MYIPAGVFFLALLAMAARAFLGEGVAEATGRDAVACPLLLLLLCVPQAPTYELFQAAPGQCTKALTQCGSPKARRSPESRAFSNLTR